MPTSSQIRDWINRLSDMEGATIIDHATKSDLLSIAGTILTGTSYGESIVGGGGAAAAGILLAVATDADDGEEIAEEILRALNA